MRCALALKEGEDGLNVVGIAWSVAVKATAAEEPGDPDDEERDLAGLLGKDSKRTRHLQPLDREAAKLVQSQSALVQRAELLVFAAASANASEPPRAP